MHQDPFLTPEQPIVHGKKNRESSKKIIYSIVCFVLVSGGFFGGYLFGTSSIQDEINVPLIGTSNEPRQSGHVLNTDKPLPKYLSRDVSFDLFWDIWNRAKKDYITKDTPDTKLFYGALSGIVASLGDPYSEFFDPETAQKFNESLKGSFDGIGAEVGTKNHQVVVVAPLPGSPAEKAGIRTGDRILFIDKRSTVDMSVDTAVTLIRGKRGTKVKLTVYHEGDKKERELTITRDKIVVPSVILEMKGDIAYIKVAHFNQDTDEGFKKAVRSLLIKQPKGLILDVRNNPGGYLDSAVAMAGYWIGDGTAVIEKYGDGRQEEYKAHGPNTLSNIRTIVLVNEGSASAAEIIAGALQDDNKATLVGMKTFGKGSVQNFQTLSDGSAIKLTIAKWLTPKGRSINEEGIEPDVKAEITEQDYEKKKDSQLEKALEMLKK